MQSAVLPVAGHSLRRAFSTSAVAQAKAKAPLRLFGVDGRYATALFTAASGQNKLEAVEKDITTLRLLKTDTKLRDFVRDPTYKRSVKAKAVNQVSDTLKQQNLTKNFLGAIAENGRMGLLNNIIRSFDMLMAAHKGQVICQIVTAKPLDSAMQKQVEQALTAFVKQGEKTQINYTIDESIIGGMKVTIGDKFVDMSIASKIHTYQHVIDQAIV